MGTGHRAIVDRSSVGVLRPRTSDWYQPPQIPTIPVELPTSCPRPLNFSFCFAARRNLGIPGCESRLETFHERTVHFLRVESPTGPRPALLLAFAAS